MVRVNINALYFCRYSTAAILIIAYYLKLEILLGIGILLLLAPSIFGIHYSPAYYIYNNFIRTKTKRILDRNSIRFAQGLGAFLLTVSLLTIFLSNTPVIGWYIVLGVGISSLFGANGKCTGMYIYSLLEKIRG